MKKKKRNDLICIQFNLSKKVKEYAPHFTNFPHKLIRLGTFQTNIGGWQTLRNHLSKKF